MRFLLAIILLLWLPVAVEAQSLPPGSCPPTSANRAALETQNNTVFTNNILGLITPPVQNCFNGNLIASVATLNDANTFLGQQTYLSTQNYATPPSFSSLTGYVYANGSSPITAVMTIPWGSINSTPTTLSGYGITSPLPFTQGGTAVSNPTITINGVAFVPGSTGTITAAAASVTIGTTTVSGGSNGNLLDISAENVGALALGTGVATALGDATNATGGFCTTGTSGANCGLLNVANTWSATQTFQSSSNGILMIGPWGGGVPYVAISMNGTLDNTSMVGMIGTNTNSNLYLVSATGGAINLRPDADTGNTFSFTTGGLLGTPYAGSGNRCLYTDPSGNITAGSVACSSSVVASAATNDIAYYTSSTGVGGITAAANSVLVTNGSNVPSLSTTLPGGLTASGIFTVSGNLISSNLISSGYLTTTSTSGPSLVNGQASIYASSTNGGLYGGKGSTFDLSLVNDSGSLVAVIPTGTLTFRLGGEIQYASSTTGAGTQTFLNSPCTGLTSEQWIPVTITGQTGTWYIPTCQ